MSFLGRSSQSVRARWLSSCLSGCVAEVERHSSSSFQLYRGETTSATSALHQHMNRPHEYTRLSDAPLEGISTLKGAVVRYGDSWHSGMSLGEALKSGDGSSKGHGSVAGLYVDLPKDSATAVNEAQPEFYHHPALTKAKVKQFDFGCKGAVHEFQSTGKRMLMYRNSTKDVIESVLESERGKRMDVLVDGWTGSGKSVSLYALVAAARAAGWVVMYIPSACLFVQGGTFKRKDEDESVFYTPTAARHVLRGVYEAHGNALESLPSVDGKDTLGGICAKGLESRDPFDPVNAATGLLQGLLKADGQNEARTLVVVDEYNYLYHRTEYHKTVHQFHRKRIEPDELILASSFRVLDQPERMSGVVAVASTYGGPVSPKLNIPLSTQHLKVVRIPRFSLEEVTTMISMHTNTANSMPDAAVKRALALTNGNGRELRQYRATLFQEDNGVELSLGRGCNR
jgi:hypothetical protein